MSRLNLKMGVGDEQPYIMAVTRNPEKYGYRDEFIVSGGNGPTQGVDWPAIGVGGVDNDDLKATTRYLAEAYNACHSAGLSVEALRAGAVVDLLAAAKDCLSLLQKDLRDVPFARPEAEKLEAAFAKIKEGGAS